MPNLDAEATIAGEAEVKAEGVPTVGAQPGVWQYRHTLKINQRMAEVVKLAIEASKMEISMLRRKVDKITYGS
jgi:hypothetical protein